jgi:hypothetical protein
MKFGLIYRWDIRKQVMEREEGPLILVNDTSA